MGLRLDYKSVKIDMKKNYYHMLLNYYCNLNAYSRNKTFVKASQGSTKHYDQWLH